MIKAIVLDIEGTTSSLSFVHDVLFPYAKENLVEYVMAMADEPEVVEQLELINQEVGRTLSLQEALEQLLRWLDEDAKVTPLKNLQGLVWEAGYRVSEFTGHVYADAARNMTSWNEKGIAIYIYSSGSVRAQQLLFGFSDFGDMTENLTGYFDTRIGAKQDPASYQHIINETNMFPGDILFLSDIKEELDAAKTAGMKTGWLVREADEVDTSAEHQQYRNFNEIELSTC
ncbi:MAG: acireductone synthase [Gammaproteobacteria bacterium]|nr:acireductone synthase [Gammaproteobacteria bacterium]